MIKTGFSRIDEEITFHPGEVIIVGARPSMGKSTFISQIAKNVAEQNFNVDYWDFEGSLERRLCGIPKNIRMRSLEYDIREIYPDDDLAKVVFVDYIQAYAKGDKRYRHLDISDIICRLKERAVADGSIIFVCSQISKEVDVSLGHRPMLNHLSCSSSLCEVSDKVILILRRDYYDPLDKPNTAEIILAKNRAGKAMTAILSFYPEEGGFCDYCRKDSLTKDEIPEAFALFVPN